MGAMIGAIASGGRSDFYDDDHDDPGSPPRPPATAKAEAALPTELVEVVPGRRVAVHHRSGRPQSDVVVFVHGSMASMLQWSAQIEHFGSRGWTVVAYDYLGCGRSPKPEVWDEYATSALLDELKGVLAKYAGANPEDRGRGRRLVLVGHSAGTSLILRYAAEAASSSTVLPLAGTVLFAPTLTTSPLVAIFRLPLWLLRLLQPTLSGGFAERALHATTRRGETDHARSVIALANEVSGSNPMHVCKAYYRQWVTPSDALVSAAAQPPALLVCGDADLIAPLEEHARPLAALLGARARDLVVVPDASHQVMQERPDECNALLASFVASLEAPPPAGGAAENKLW